MVRNSIICAVLCLCAVGESYAGDSFDVVVQAKDKHFYGVLHVEPVVTGREPTPVEGFLYYRYMRDSKGRYVSRVDTYAACHGELTANGTLTVRTSGCYGPHKKSRNTYTHNAGNLDIEAHFLPDDSIKGAWKFVATGTHGGMILGQRCAGRSPGLLTENSTWVGEQLIRGKPASCRFHVTRRIDRIVRGELQIDGTDGSTPHPLDIAGIVEGDSVHLIAVEIRTPGSNYDYSHKATRYTHLILGSARVLAGTASGQPVYLVPE